MDQRTRKINFRGELVDAVEMGFQTGGEHWNEYVLTDGSVIRFKAVVTDILKVPGVFDAEGNPTYVVRSAAVVAVSASERSKQG